MAQMLCTLQTLIQCYCHDKKYHSQLYSSFFGWEDALSDSGGRSIHFFFLVLFLTLQRSAPCLRAIQAKEWAPSWVGTEETFNYFLQEEYFILL